MHPPQRPAGFVDARHPHLPPLAPSTLKRSEVRISTKSPLLPPLNILPSRPRRDFCFSTCPPKKIIHILWLSSGKKIAINRSSRLKGRAQEPGCRKVRGRNQWQLLLECNHSHPSLADSPRNQSARTRHQIFPHGRQNAVGYIPISPEGSAFSLFCARKNITL